MPSNIDSFLGNMTKAKQQVIGAREESVKASALLVTTGIRNQIHQAAPGGRLSGVGKNGTKVGAAFSFKGGQNPSALIVARGPLHLIERDTTAHAIRPKSRRGPRAVLKIGDKFVAHSHPVAHPGTKGKHPFEKGYDRSKQFVGPVMRKSVHNSLAKVFSG